MLSLGIDGGASSAKWSLIDDAQQIIKSGVSHPVDGHLYRTESLAKFTKFCAEIKNQLAGLQPDVITIGITGFGAPDLIKAELLKVFANAQISMSTDIALAYHSEFSPGEGIYLYAGTGSIAVHISKDSQEITAGGWGYLLGDEGAGYWIGREALRHLMLQIESHQSLDELSIAVSEVVGGANWSQVREYVYSKDRSAIAALSPTVVHSANSGTESAKGILASAAGHLFDLVTRLRKTIGNPNLPLAFGGGISEKEVGVSDLLETKLGGAIKISKSDHSLTAAKLGLTILDQSGFTEKD